MRELVRVLILLVSVGFSTADGQAQQPSTTSHQGYMRCSLGTNQELIPVYLEPCQLPVSNLACGEKVTVLERHSPSWLKIQTPDGITRYMRSFTVSQAPDKFVAFDEGSDIPKSNAADCSSLLSSPVFRVGGGVSAPHPLSTPDPEYSDEAREAGYQGSCDLRVIVGTDGKIHDIKVVRSVGHGLDQKAMEAVEQWKFSPAMLTGRPVAVEISVTVNFRVKDGRNSGTSSH